MTEHATERVEDALGEVVDPDFGVNVVDAGLVTDVAVADRTATLSVDLAGADPEQAEEIIESARSAAFGVEGIEHVRVEGETPVAGGGHAGPADSSDGPGVSLPSVEHVIAVGSAKGGVGKTTVATHLARALADDYDVGLFDADIHGPNVPELLGVEGPVEATDDGRAEPHDADGVEVMSVGLVANDAPLAWRGAMAHDALTELLEDTAWSALDVLVIDLPPGTGDVVLTTLQEVPVSGALLVTTPFPTSLSDTGRSAALFEENGVPVAGAAVNMAGFTCEECGHDHDLYGATDPEEQLGVPVLAELPFDRAMQNPGPASESDAGSGSLPQEVEAVAEGVTELLESDETGPVSVPDSALDVRGLPPRIRHEQVGEEFRALEPGEEFYVVNDHDPSPLAQMLAGEFTDESAAEEAFDTCEVHRRAPDEWVLQLQRAA